MKGLNVFFASLCLLISACKQRMFEENNSSESDVKHVYNNFFIKPSTFIPCEFIYKLFPDDPILIPDYSNISKKAEIHLKNIVKQIMVSNSNIFSLTSDTQKFSFTDFCFPIIKSVNPYDIGATALSSLSKTISASHGLFLTAANDASIAAVLAHELGHMVTFKYYPDYPPEFENLPKIKILIKKYNDLVNPIRPTLDDILALVNLDLSINFKKFMVDTDILSPYRTYLNSYTEAIIKEKIANDSAAYSNIVYKLEDIDKVIKTHPKSTEEDKANWQKNYSIYLKRVALIDKVEESVVSIFLELQKEAKIFYKGKESELNTYGEKLADEVGLEMYLKAGFSKDEYVNQLNVIMDLYHKIAKQNKDKEIPLSSIECQKIIKNKKIPPFYDSTSDKEHPGTCWRRYNIEINEIKKKHLKEYATLIAKAKILNIPNSLLAEIKKELLINASH